MSTTPKLIDSLWERYRAGGDARTRALLLDQYIGLVHHAARELVRRIPPGLQLEDLVSAGTIGLVQALENFEPARGLAFSTFAMPRIRGSMLDELRSWDWVPRSVRDRTRRIAKTRASLEQRLGRAPTEPELAEMMGVDVETCRRWISETVEPVLIPIDGSAHGTDEGAGPHRLHEMLPDTRLREPDESILRGEALDDLREAIDALSQKERMVLSLYYYEQLTLRQIGVVLHITESRVSQIHTRAIGRMREWIRQREVEAA